MRTSAGPNGRNPQRSSWKLFIWNQTVHFSQRQSPQNSTNATPLFLRPQVYFHFSILKKLKGETLRNSSEAVFSQSTQDGTVCTYKAAEVRMLRRHVAAAFLWVIQQEAPWAPTLKVTASPVLQHTEYLQTPGQRIQPATWTLPAHASLLSLNACVFCSQCKTLPEWRAWKWFCLQPVATWIFLQFSIDMRAWQKDDSMDNDPQVANDKSTISKFLSLAFFQKSKCFLNRQDIARTIKGLGDIPVL